MVMHFPSPAEVRRGGWLSRAEGRVKTKGVPQGPRSERTRRILAGANDDFFSHAEGGDVLGVRREVGSGRRNDARDVIAVKRALHDAGLYTMPCPAAPSPYFDSNLSLAIRIYQDRQGLKSDGVIRPGDLAAKGLVDAAQTARCRALATQVQTLRAKVGRASQSVVEAQNRLENVKGTIEELEAELRVYAVGKLGQAVLTAIARRLTGPIADLVDRISPAIDINLQANERTMSALRSLDKEKEIWEGRLAQRNAFLNETLRQLDGLLARQRRHGCPT